MNSGGRWKMNWAVMLLVYLLGGAVFVGFLLGIFVAIKFKTCYDKCLLEGKNEEECYWECCENSEKY
jgi:NhaP-type Na+/H+ or K+/H+ antiporter